MSQKRAGIDGWGEVTGTITVCGNEGSLMWSNDYRMKRKSAGSPSLYTFSLPWPGPGVSNSCSFDGSSPSDANLTAPTGEWRDYYSDFTIGSFCICILRGAPYIPRPGTNKDMLLPTCWILDEGKCIDGENISYLRHMSWTNLVYNSSRLLPVRWLFSNDDLREKKNCMLDGKVRACVDTRNVHLEVCPSTKRCRWFDNKLTEEYKIAHPPHPWSNEMQ